MFLEKLLNKLKEIEIMQDFICMVLLDSRMLLIMDLEKLTVLN
jgi:hypothetical protein